MRGFSARRFSYLQKPVEPKKILCIHDLSGVGRCSLAVILPVLSVMGFQPVALPTVVLSNLMLDEAKKNNISLTRESFQKFGKDVELFRGVKQWFSLVNEYGNSIGLDVKHYINSSGLKEMIEGTPIAHEFENIYACSFLYNKEGTAY